jgi:uncharacterized protein
MKNLLLAFSIVASSVMYAQTITPTPVAERTIHLTGTAELEIIPDEIYVSVTLREFTKEKKKYTIEELEKSFLNFVETTTTTPRADVKMDNTDATVIALKRKQKDAVIDKTYEVKFKNNTQVILLFSAADSLNINYVHINRYSHSKIEEYKRDVRVAAVANGKEKATYMLAALGQKPGRALTLVEKNPFVRIDDGIEDFRPFRGNVFATQYSYQRSSGDNMGSTATPLIKTIKLSYEVEMSFEIVN